MIEQNRAGNFGITTNLRPMGSLERWFWLIGQHRPNHFVMAAEIHGTAKPEQWLEASRKVQKRHPLLNASLLMDEEGKAHYFRSTDASIPITFKTWSFLNQQHEEVKRELTIPFDTNISPLMRLTILEGDERCIILLTFHHAIADGMSSLFILRDLLSSVSGNSLSELAVPPSQDELIRAMSLTAPAGDGATAVPHSYREFTSASPHVGSAELTPVETSALLARSRQEQTTLHGAIIAAAVLAGRSISAKWRNSVVRVFSPVSLRQTLTVSEASVIALGVAPSKFESDSADNLWELARSTRSQMLPFLKKDAAAGTLALFDFLTAANASVETVATSTAKVLGFELMVSNLQTLPFETRFGDLYLHRVWGPAVTFSNEGEQDIGAITSNGALSLSYTSYAPLEGMLENTVERLREAIAGKAV